MWGNFFLDMKKRYFDSRFTLYRGDARACLQTLANENVGAVATAPRTQVAARVSLRETGRSRSKVSTIRCKADLSSHVGRRQGPKSVFDLGRVVADRVPALRSPE